MLVTHSTSAIDKLLIEQYLLDEDKLGNAISKYKVLAPHIEMYSVDTENRLIRL